MFRQEEWVEFLNTLPRWEQLDLIEKTMELCKYMVTVHRFMDLYKILFEFDMDLIWT